jgi:CHAT domain-containing protein
LYEPARVAYTQVLAHKSFPKENRPTLLTALGLVQGNLGLYQDALKNLETASKEATELKNQLAMVQSLSNQGILNWELGQLPKALDLLQQAQNLSRQFNLRRYEGVDHNNIGAVYKTAGQWQKAIASFDSAYEIAREVGNRRDEAIALANRALMEMLTGQQEAARRDYNHALELYQEVQFEEGVGSTLIGLAKIDSNNRNYVGALDKLLQAKEIFERLNLAFQLPIVYVELGVVYQRGFAPRRSTTRAFVFEDEETNNLEIDPDEALNKSDEFFAKAGQLALKYNMQHFLWKSYHGRAFVAKNRGDLLKAEELYSKAIQIVISTKTLEENRELLLNYLNDKEDLFEEAIDVCRLLVNQTSNTLYMNKMSEYEQIYRNEVHKANYQMSNIQYTELEKSQLFNSIQQSSAELIKITESAQNAILATESPNPSQAAPETAKFTEEARILAEDEYEKLVSEWSQKYPNDRRMFDTIETINYENIQRKLSNNQAIIQYIPLDDELVIIVITDTNLYYKSYPISYSDLAKLITFDFLYTCIEQFKLSYGSYDKERVSFVKTNNVLNDITKILYNPIKEFVEDKDRLFIVTSKFISYVPFNALILDLNADIEFKGPENGRQNTRPRYLVDEKTISMVRLSFFNDSFDPNTTQFNKNIISIGNPSHAIFSVGFKTLKGAEAESENIINICNSRISDSANNCVKLIGLDAKRVTFEEKIKNNPFGIMHFATHGISFSGYKANLSLAKQTIENEETSSSGPTQSLRFYTRMKLFDSYANHFFKNNSYFNGFLYFSLQEDDIFSTGVSIKTIYENYAYNPSTMSQVTNKINEIIPRDLFINTNTPNKLSEVDPGMLTMKYLIELNDNYFKDSYIAILSACYTAVNLTTSNFESFSGTPELLEFTQDELAKHQNELDSLGWKQGIEEICLVDIFMSKNFRFVTGNLWVAEDNAASQILLTFVENIYDSDVNDPARSFNEAIKSYLESPPDSINDLEPTHPFFWAVVNIFGN